MRFLDLHRSFRSCFSSLLVRFQEPKVVRQLVRHRLDAQRTLKNIKKLADEPVSRILSGAPFAKRTARRGDHSSRSRFAP